MRPIQMLLLRSLYALPPEGGSHPSTRLNDFARSGRTKLSKQLMAAAHRQRHPEARAARGGRADIDPSVMRIHDLPNDCQTEPRALRLGREERAEDAIHDVSRHAGTV